MKLRYLAILLVSLLIFHSCKDQVEEFDPNAIEDKGPENSNIPYFVINSTGSIIDEPKTPATLAVFVNQELVFSNRIGIELRGSTSRRLFLKRVLELSFGMRPGKIFP